MNIKFGGQHEQYNKKKKNDKKQRKRKQIFVVGGLQGNLGIHIHSV